MSSPVAHTSIDIQAPISLVYTVLLHFAAYPDWNPFIVEVTNITPNPSLHPISTNTTFTLHVNFSDGTTATSQHRVTEVTPPDGDGDVGAGGVRKAVLAYRVAGALAALGVVESTRFQWLEQRENAAGVTTSRQGIGRRKCFGDWELGWCHLSKCKTGLNGWPKLSRPGRNPCRKLRCLFCTRERSACGGFLRRGEAAGEPAGPTPTQNLPHAERSLTLRAEGTH